MQAKWMIRLAAGALAAQLALTAAVSAAPGANEAAMLKGCGKLSEHPTGGGYLLSI